MNISSLMDDKLQDLAHNILEMKHVSIFSTNSTLTKLRTYPHNFWSSKKLKTFLTLGASVSVAGVIAQPIGSYCKCFQNKKSCVHKHTRLTTMPANDTHIELQPISNSVPDISDQLSPQIIQEILKASSVDISKFECYMQCKVLCQTSAQATKLH